MSDLYTQLRYSTGEFQALQMIFLTVFGAVDWPLASCMLVYVLENIFLSAFISSYTANYM